MKWSVCMRIIARKALVDFYERKPESKASLESWYQEVKRAVWKSPIDVFSQFPKARSVSKDRVIFKILGNRYRLIVRIHYESEIIYIRFVGTHSDYDRIDVRSV